MSDNIRFEFGEVLSATQKLRRDLLEATKRSEDPKVRALSKELDEVKVTGASSEAPPLTIAFVGQYDAGKSTVVRVLTGREDIVIDSDVSTVSVTAYDWNGVRLLDTPGVHSGHPDHDEKTYAIIDRADLLVFVITSELFDNTIGHHFRELAFNRQHARRMLLVVNKMDLDPGSPESKRQDIEKVTAPLTISDFRGVFIDARSWLEAQEADDEDRADLLEIANIDALIKALNAFIAERGLAGRLSAPLFTMRGISEQASALLATDFPQERAALELLYRKRSILLLSRSRLQTAMSGLVVRAVTDIGKYGDEVAEAIEPGKSENDLEALHAAAQGRANERSNALSNEARQCVETELEELRCQLDALRNGVLARELTAHLEVGAPGDVGLGDLASPVWEARSAGKDPADWHATGKKAGNVAKGIGNWAGRWATGPAAADGASVFGTAAARGSDAHKAVYNVGKFFGVKFQPWGAVKAAKAIGNAGRIVAVVGGFFAVFAQIAEDHQQEQYRLQLRDARDEVRSAYRDSALSVEAAFWERFDLFVADFYDSEMLAIEEIVNDLVGKRSERSSDVSTFHSLKQRATSLIDQVSTKRLEAPVG